VSVTTQRIFMVFGNGLHYELSDEFKFTLLRPSYDYSYNEDDDKYLAIVVRRCGSGRGT
jgi:hypothetical protein